MNIVFYGNNYHMGDIFFFKSFLKKFCEINKNVHLLLQSKEYKCNNYFLFSDIPNLNLVYNDDGYKMYVYDNYKIINNNIYINIWVGVHYKYGNTNLKDIECKLMNINNYYNSIINYITVKFKLNYKLIPNNYKELPTIPYTNIDNFLEFKKNKKTIFYYNVYPRSGQSVPVNNQDKIIEKLADLYKDYYIICSDRTKVNKINVINTIDAFNNDFKFDGENIAKYLYYGLNSDFIILFDVGACFYILNDKIKNYKGKIIHINSNEYYYNAIQSVLNMDNYINLNVKNEEELLNDKIQKLMDF